jgi:hypothetical protein
MEYTLKGADEIEGQRFETFEAAMAAATGYLWEHSDADVTADYQLGLVAAAPDRVIWIKRQS